MREFFMELMKRKAPPIIPITEDMDPLLLGKALGSPSNTRPKEEDGLAKKIRTLAPLP
jgi:hypothetical protein